MLIVQRLESGGAPLEESLALWERGEAARCDLPGVAGRSQGEGGRRSNEGVRCYRGDLSYSASGSGSPPVQIAASAVNRLAQDRLGSLWRAVLSRCWRGLRRRPPTPRRADRLTPQRSRSGHAGPATSYGRQG